ncbi:arylsulfatase [Alienimonas californiensis]|uniref:Arylsulfatase n=1 Tax=Alienimonas californiensis TaxID=2527989 RepID=A0A517P3K1_9PLAN|nr:arylsulfatase [Alienimonas californiensis]QDT13949.1 Arylsulfatase [Alienimonas californiensis]
MLLPLIAALAAALPAADAPAAAPQQTSAQTASAAPPNVVFIMCDDLGWGDLGCFGQEIIQTPRLDALAAAGMKLTAHYSGFPVCAPARCSLMTGMHAGHSYIRGNGFPKSRVKDEARGLFPGQNPIPADAVTVAELFQSRGYATAAAGKWGLGWEGSTGDPTQQGFDRFFGYVCQWHAHNHFPRFLWDMTADGREQIRYPGNDRTLHGETYSQDEFFRVADEFVTANRDEPFFLYLPLVTTHLSLQVPEDEPSLAEYRRTIEEEDYKHTAYLKHPTPRAAYAAMVTRIDRQVGELLDRLDELGLTENTLVVFTSDNGPVYDRLGGADSDYFNSAGGFRGRKGSIYEGGLREPAIVRMPGVVAPGTVSDRPTYFADWLPTLTDLTGGELPEGLAAEIDGVSFAPTLRGEPQPAPEFLYWEFPAYTGQQAVRVGDWKAVRTGLSKVKPGEPIKTELYNLADDPTESTDVADAHPQKLAELIAVMEREHEPSALFPLRALDGRKAAPAAR